MVRAAIVVAMLCPIVAVPAHAQGKFSNPTAGISLLPPAGWNVVTMQDVMDNRAKVRVSDSELQAGLQRATAPLFVFAKYPEPHTTLNPTVQIVLRPNPARTGTAPTVILTSAVQTMQKIYPDFRFVEPVRSSVVSGMPAAYMKATYTLHTQQGNAHRILSRTWLVPRGASMFLIGMSGPTEGADVSENEFAAALASIEIQP